MEDQPIYEQLKDKIVKTWTFKTNWNNKLDCKYYTTFRFYNKGQLQKGDLVRCQLIENHKVVKDEVKQVYFIAKSTLMEVNPWLCYLDTGYGYVSFINMVQTMYKKYNVDWKKQLFAFYLLGEIKQENLQEN